MHRECRFLFGETWLRKDKKMTNRRAVGQEYESWGQLLVLGGTQFTICKVYEGKVRRKGGAESTGERRPTTGEITQERSGKNPDQPGKTTLCQ